MYSRVGISCEHFRDIHILRISHHNLTLSIRTIVNIFVRFRIFGGRKLVAAWGVTSKGRFVEGICMYNMVLRYGGCVEPNLGPNIFFAFFGSFVSFINLLLIIWMNCC